MKIKINEKETYEIQLDNEVSLQHLKDLVNRIEILSGTPTITPVKTEQAVKTEARKYVIVNDDISDIACPKCNSQKLYKKGFSNNGSRRLVCRSCGHSFTVKEEGENKPKVKKRRKVMKWEGRVDVIKALKIHYFGTRAEKMQFAEYKKGSWETITKAIHVLRKKFNISPQEVGLQKYPVNKKINEPTEFTEPEHTSGTMSISEPKPEPVQEQSEPKQEQESKWWNRNK